MCRGEPRQKRADSRHRSQGPAARFGNLLAPRADQVEVEIRIAVDVALGQRPGYRYGRVPTRLKQAQAAPESLEEVRLPEQACFNLFQRSCHTG